MPSNSQIVDVQSKLGPTPNFALNAFETDPANGDTVVVFYMTFAGTLAAMAVPTDNYGNTYISTGLGVASPFSTICLQGYVCHGVVSGPGFVVTCNTNTGGFSVGQAWAISAADVPAADYTTARLVASTFAAVGPLSPAPSANSIILAVACVNDSSNLSWPAGYNAIGDGFTSAMRLTGRAINNNWLSGGDIWAAYKITSIAETPTWPTALPGTNVCAIAFTMPFFSPGPVPTSVAPGVGATSGGTLCTISGNTFDDSATVTFDGVPATSVVVVDPNTITCLSPAHAAGLAAITVTTSAGSGSLPDTDFEYKVAPVPSSVAPQFVLTPASGRATIKGTGFESGCTVTFGGVSAANVTFVDSTTITCDIPTHAAGQVVITVTNP